MKIISTCLLWAFPWLLLSQSDKTIETSDFMAEGAKLIINFDIPEEPGGDIYSFHIESAYIYTVNSSKTRIKTMVGDLESIKSGGSYQIVWDVLEDTDELDNPTVVEINLSYTHLSRIKAEEEEARLEKESLKRQQQAEEEEEQQRIEWKMREEEAIRHERKASRRYNKPMAIGFVGHSGYVHGNLSNADEDITSQPGYGYGLGMFLEITMGGSTYLQVEGNYVVRNYYFRNNGDNTEYNFQCAAFYDTDRAHVSFSDYRIVGKVKMGSFQIGGYFSYIQEARRQGQLFYSSQCSGNFSHIEESQYEYDLLDNELYPVDRKGGRAIQNDYGITMGLETNARNHLVFGIGYDYSLQSLINNDYEGWEDADNIDFYPSKEADLRLGYAYLRFGVRF